MSSGNEVGLQPAGLQPSTIANLLGSFANLDAIKRSEKVLEKVDSEAKLKPRAKATVENVLSILVDLNGNPAILKREQGVFTDAVPLIHNRLANKAYAEPIRMAAFEIAREALVELPVPKPAQGAKAPPTQAEPVLKPAHFARQLEQFILAKTGIVLSLKLNHAKVTAPSGKDVNTVDEQNPVKEIRILHVHLPFIDGRSPLWKDAIHNTWGDPTGKDLENIRIHARAHAERRGIVPGIWALFGKEYKFSFFFKKAVDDLVKLSTSAGALDPNDLRPWDEYADTNKNIPSNIGVRLATHDDVSQKGAGRHAHHLTQYLLANYFANANKTKQPFRPGRDYPGVTWKGVMVDLISPQPNASEDASIRVSKTEEGRGKDMPTISLAAVTHLSGNLHLTQDPDDLPRGTKKVQGDWVEEQFTSKLPPALLAKADETVFQKFRKERSDPEIAGAIYSAAQSTYSAVVARMSKKLKTRMPEGELKYYKVLAEGTRFDLRDQTDEDKTTNAETKFKTELEKVPAIAKTHNEKIMREQFGWKVQ
jgi:hypothetical protein